MDINEIMETLPHRYPFLLIDKIIKIEEESKKIIAIKNVTINEPFFAGHFPKEPVMPGVLIIEAMAQAGAVFILKLEEYKGKTAYFGAINNVKFKQKVVPGDTLKIEVELVKLKKNAGIAKGEVYVLDKKVAEAEFTFIIL